MPEILGFRLVQICELHHPCASGADLVTFRSLHTVSGFLFMPKSGRLRLRFSISRSSRLIHI
jgi:hypothetical protein